MLKRTLTFSKTFTKHLSTSYRSISKFNETDRQTALSLISTWKYNSEKDAIEKTFEFKTHDDTLQFLKKLADYAELVTIQLLNQKF